MKHLKRILLCLFFLSAAAEAQSSGSEATTTSGGKKGAVKVVRKQQFEDYSLGLITWQEDIKASRGSESTLMLTQSVGFKGGMSWNKFFESGSWRQWHSAEIAIGQLKGQGNTATIPDELKKQSFVMLQGTPGLMWRTSPVSELGFGVPIAFRYIKWDLITSSALKMDKQSSFSAGFSLTYVNRFSARNSLQITIAHQHMWNTTQWGAGFSRAF